MTDIFFVVLSCVSVVMAILVVSPRNPIHAAMALLVMMLALSGVFLQLAAPFLAIMQIVVYAGAVIVMFVFVIMLMNLDPVELGEEKGLWFKGIAICLAGFMALFLVVAVFKSKEGLPPGFPEKGTQSAAVAAAAGGPTSGTLESGFHGKLAVDFGSTPAVGEALFEPYLLPFELVSILIVIAVVGAVVLAKRKLE
ncbi:MAG: NADH-quinone oxidoreductase subunit J family protein [Planctomycetota bacterium]|jgi:NADH-quinone oxidoreductase subunit J